MKKTLILAATVSAFAFSAVAGTLTTSDGKPVGTTYNSTVAVGSGEAAAPVAKAPAKAKAVKKAKKAKAKKAAAAPADAAAPAAH